VFAGAAPELQERRDRLRQLVTELAQAGVTLLQYRNKVGSDVEVIEDLRVIRQALTRLEKRNMTLILNDRLSLVAATGCNGVHVGQDDWPPRDARSLLGPQAIVGVSTHNDDQVCRADLQPVDYIAIGPVSGTASKADTSPVIGLAGVERARALTSKPLVAIGGITLEDATTLYGAGADSLAVIAAIFAPGRRAGDVARQFLAIHRAARPSR